MKRVLNQGRICLEITWGKIELYDFDADREEDLPQEAKSLHSGRTCGTLRRRV
jgi:hypothetical protein